jgi:glycerophosphoryl diester phosphodiesterase
MARDERVKPMARVYAHRGASLERPENTLCAFERALELGVDALETDLHRTADGHLVLSHDPVLTRTCGVPMVIATSSFADVRSCDAGWGFVAPDGARPFAEHGICVPTLDELLDTFPKVTVNVDLKPRGRDVVDAVIARLRRRGDEGRVHLASFHPATLHAIRRAGYPGGTSLTVAEVLRVRALPLPWLRTMPPGGTAAQVPVAFRGLRFDTKDFIARCHALSLRVDYWTVNDPMEARRLVALGADGIMTDDPARIVPALRPTSAIPSPVESPIG